MIKLLYNERKEDMVTPGRKSYSDEDGRYVSITKVNTSYFLELPVNGYDCTLHLKI